jgi:hypothetical protein
VNVWQKKVDQGVVEMMIMVEIHVGIQGMDGY